MPTREDGWKLLCEYTASESLRKHMLAVEACGRALGREAGAGGEAWGLASPSAGVEYELRPEGRTHRFLHRRSAGARRRPGAARHPVSGHWLGCSSSESHFTESPIHARIVRNAYTD